MSAAGNDKHNAVFFVVNDAVHIVDTAAPPAAERTAQRFRFADAVKCVAGDILDQRVDAFQRLILCSRRYAKWYW